MSLLPSYTHIVNNRLKHTYLSFDDEGNLIIKSPKISTAYLEKLLLKKAAWISRSREKIRSKKGKQTSEPEKAEIYFLGKAYPLHTEQHEKKRVSLRFEESHFLLQYHHYDATLTQKHIDSFYRDNAKAYIPSLVDVWAARMELSPNKVSFRKTKRQWGSCSGKNDLSFNTMMMKLPPDVIQYIIVHELAHIRHKHHQKAFWAMVGKYLPDYKQQVQELKTYTTY